MWPRDDEAMERLDVPARLHELDGEPVEQLRVRRDRALRAEVLARLDDAAPEVLLPETVDEDAAVSGWRRSNNQCQGRVGSAANVVPGQHGVEAFREHALAGVAVHAAVQDERRRGFRRVAHHEDLRNAGREPFS